MQMNFVLILMSMSCFFLFSFVLCRKCFCSFFVVFLCHFSDIVSLCNWYSTEFTIIIGTCKGKKKRPIKNTESSIYFLSLIVMNLCFNLKNSTLWLFLSFIVEAMNFKQNKQYYCIFIWLLTSPKDVRGDCGHNRNSRRYTNRPST